LFPLQCHSNNLLSHNEIKSFFTLPKKQTAGAGRGVAHVVESFKTNG
jgi:hypothetical protein